MEEKASAAEAWAQEIASQALIEFKASQKYEDKIMRVIYRDDVQLTYNLQQDISGDLFC